MLFSVIVPVYNTKQYLEVCVRSILGQTCSDFELILVDDGSTDGSSTLCDTFSGMDERIRVLHQANGGVSAARLAGLERARGAYVIFADSDDWLEQKALELAQTWIALWQPQLISFAHICEQPGKSILQQEPAEEGLYDRKRLCREIWPKVLMDKTMKNMSFLPGKIAERSLMKQCMRQVETELTLGEDAVLSYWLYCSAGKVYISGEGCYHYRVLEQSASHGFRMAWYDQVERTIRYFEHVRQPIVPDFEDQLHRYTAMVLLSMLLMMVEAKDKKALPEAKKKMKKRCFRDHMSRARFHGVSPKTAAAFFLLRRGWFETAYDFLAVCEAIKRGVRKIWESDRN